MDDPVDWTARARRIAAHARERRDAAQRRIAWSSQAADAALRRDAWIRGENERFARELKRRYERAGAEPAGLRRRLAFFDPEFGLVADRAALLEALLDAALHLTRTERGNVQLVVAAPTGLRIVTQRGFDRAFLDYFAFVGDDSTACGAALARAAAVPVPDVRRSPLFRDGPARDHVLDAGVRAVNSIPLAGLGVFSVHFDRPRRVDPAEVRLLTVLADSATRRLALRPPT